MASIWYPVDVVDGVVWLITVCVLVTELEIWNYALYTGVSLPQYIEYKRSYNGKRLATTEQQDDELCRGLFRYIPSSLWSSASLFIYNRFKTISSWVKRTSRRWRVSWRGYSCPLQNRADIRGAHHITLHCNHSLGPSSCTVLEGFVDGRAQGGPCESFAS